MFLHRAVERTRRKKVTRKARGGGRRGWQEGMANWEEGRDMDRARETHRERSREGEEKRSRCRLEKQTTGNGCRV